MIHKKYSVAGVVLLCAISFSVQAFGPKKGDLLEGDERDACEIKVCLDSLGTNIKQCDRALKVWEKTRPSKRPELLRKCPDGEKD